MATIFEQQPDEGDKAYAAFKFYLDLGPDRSLRQVSSRLGKSLSLVQRWANRFNWRQRVLAHSAELMQLQTQTASSVLRASLTDWAQRQLAQREEEWHWRTELLQVAQEIVARWRSEPNRFESIASLAKILELASKLGRLSAGLPTDKTELTGADGGAIRVELDAALKKIYGRPLPGEVVEVHSEESKLHHAEQGEPTCIPNSPLGQLPAPHSEAPVPEAPSTIAQCFGSSAPNVPPVPEERPNRPASGGTHD